MYVALPHPHKICASGSKWEPPHPILDCQIHKRMSIQGMDSEYRSTIAGSFKNNSKNKKRKNYEIMKTEK